MSANPGPNSASRAEPLPAQVSEWLTLFRTSPEQAVEQVLSDNFWVQEWDENYGQRDQYGPGFAVSFLIRICATEQLIAPAELDGALQGWLSGLAARSWPGHGEQSAASSQIASAAFDKLLLLFQFSCGQVALPRTEAVLVDNAAPLRQLIHAVPGGYDGFFLERLAVLAPERLVPLWKDLCALNHPHLAMAPLAEFFEAKHRGIDPRSELLTLGLRALTTIALAGVPAGSKPAAPEDVVTQAERLTAAVEAIPNLCRTSSKFFGFCRDVLRCLDNFAPLPADRINASNSVLKAAYELAEGRSFVAGLQESRTGALAQRSTPCIAELFCRPTLENGALVPSTARDSRFGLPIDVLPAPLGSRISAICAEFEGFLAAPLPGAALPTYFPDRLSLRQYPASLWPSTWSARSIVVTLNRREIFCRGEDQMYVVKWGGCFLNDPLDEALDTIIFAQFGVGTEILGLRNRLATAYANSREEAERQAAALFYVRVPTAHEALRGQVHRAPEDFFVIPEALVQELVAYPAAAVGLCVGDPYM